MDPFSFIWNEGLVRPLINGLVLFYGFLGSNFGLSILAITLITRVIMYPLTVRQLRSTRAMSKIQPKMKEIQEKFKNDRSRQQREQMKLFKEAGVNPLGCLGPIFLQFPIFIALFQSLRTVLADTPESLVALSDKLYAGLPFADQSIPLDQGFLGMELGEMVSANPAGFSFILPVAVGVSTWLVQKATAMPSTDPNQQSTQRMLQWMMPIMLGFFTMSFPAGLAVYWISSNLVSLALQIKISGGLGGLAPATKPTAVPGLKAGGGHQKQDEAQERAASRQPGLGEFLKRVFLGSETVADPQSGMDTSDDEAEDEDQPIGGQATTEREVADGRNRNDGQVRRGRDPKSSRPTRRGPRRRRGRRSR